jgi:hypothetical protein
MSAPAERPTTDADLLVLVKLLAELPGLTPARLELSIEDGIVTAQVMADKIAVPLAAQGADASSAPRAGRGGGAGSQGEAPPPTGETAAAMKMGAAPLASPTPKGRRP